MFTRKQIKGGLEPREKLFNALPQEHVDRIVQEHLDAQDYRCQICNGALYEDTMVQRRAWYNAETLNYLHADARECLVVLRRTVNAQKLERYPHETL